MTGGTGAEITYTRHARDKMQALHISETEVVRVMTAPDVEIPTPREGSPNRKARHALVNGRRIRVVFDPAGVGNKVISVYPL